MADAENLARLQDALDELEAELFHVPTLTEENLQHGHAVHFRCRHPDALKLRVDLMAKMRGVVPFNELWERRTSFTDTDGIVFELLALPELVLAKKTQRDKDWPMLKRLVEAHYLRHRAKPETSQVKFWLRELRTPELLTEVAAAHPGLGHELAGERKLLSPALSGDLKALADSLAAEEQEEREQDRIYWQPLKAELEKLRHQK